MWACYYYISFKVCLDIKIRGIKMSREDSLDNTLNIDTSLLMDEIKENERYFRQYGLCYTGYNLRYA